MDEAADEWRAREVAKGIAQRKVRGWGGDGWGWDGPGVGGDGGR